MNGYNEGYRCEGNETLLAIVAILLTFVSAHKSLSMTSRFVREPPWRPVLKSSRLPCYLLFFYFPKCTMGHFQPKSVKNIDVCKYLTFWSCLGIFKSCFVSHSKCSKLWLKIFFFSSLINQSECLLSIFFASSFKIQNTCPTVHDELCGCSRPSSKTDDQR